MASSPFKNIWFLGIYLLVQILSPLLGENDRDLDVALAKGSTTGPSCLCAYNYMYVTND